MNKAIANEWIKRLRSGDYEKGVTFMGRTCKQGTFHCATGVLAELAIERGVCTKEWDHREHVYRYGEDRKDTYLPEKVREWAGISLRGEVSVQDMNDDYQDCEDGMFKNTFRDIADYINDNVERL